MYNIARGIDLEPVTPRLIPESIGCCKNFPGLNALKTITVIKQWLNELASEIAERLAKDIEKNKRRAKLLTVSFYQETAMSRSCALNSYETNSIANEAFNLLKKFNTAAPNTDSWNPPIKFLGLSASKFENEQMSIGKYLKSIPATKDLPKKGIIESKSNGLSILPGKDIVEKESNEPSTSGIQKPQSSFFLSFLNKKGSVEDNKVEEESDEEENANMWISLSEVFPNMNEVDDDVVELLPNEMKEKYKQRLSSTSDNEKNGAPDIVKKIQTEMCNECKKNIPIDEFLEHLDYHAAMKLHAEINRAADIKPKVNNIDNNNGKVNVGKVSSVEKNKRKKGGNAKPIEKKMKSITSFFSAVPKN